MTLEEFAGNGEKRIGWYIHSWEMLRVGRIGNKNHISAFIIMFVEIEELKTLAKRRRFRKQQV